MAVCVRPPRSRASVPTSHTSPADPPTLLPHCALRAGPLQSALTLTATPSPSLVPASTCPLLPPPATVFSDSKFRFSAPRKTVLTHANKRTIWKCFSGVHLPCSERTGTVPKDVMAVAGAAGRTSGFLLAQCFPVHTCLFLCFFPLAAGPVSWLPRETKQIFTCGALGFGLG